MFRMKIEWRWLVAVGQDMKQDYGMAMETKTDDVGCCQESMGNQKEDSWILRNASVFAAPSKKKHSTAFEGGYGSHRSSSQENRLELLEMWNAELEGPQVGVTNQPEEVRQRQVHDLFDA